MKNFFPPCLQLLGEFLGHTVAKLQAVNSALVPGLKHARHLKSLMNFSGLLVLGNRNQVLHFTRNLKTSPCHGSVSPCSQCLPRQLPAPIPALWVEMQENLPLGPSVSQTNTSRGEFFIFFQISLHEELYLIAWVWTVLFFFFYSSVNANNSREKKYLT